MVKYRPITSPSTILKVNKNAPDVANTSYPCTQGEDKGGGDHPTNTQLSLFQFPTFSKHRSIRFSDRSFPKNCNE